MSKFYWEVLEVAAMAELVWTACLLQVLFASQITEWRSRAVYERFMAVLTISALLAIGAVYFLVWRLR